MKKIILLLALVIVASIVKAQNSQLTINDSICQPFTISLDSSSTTFTFSNGIYTINSCPNDTINIIAVGNYYSNDSIYHQSDSLTSFNWTSSIGTAINNNFQVINTVPQITLMETTAIDSNNCPALDTLRIRLNLSPSISFNGTIQSDSAVCQRDSIILIGSASGGTINGDASFHNNNTTYIPDGSGVSYISYINITNGSTGQTIQSGNDISVLATLEHSYLGDLNITLTCPSGNSVTLKSYPGGSNTFLGEPLDNNALPVPGLGYEYVWNMNGSATMSSSANTYTHTFIDLLGDAMSNYYFLPPSTSYPINSNASGPFPLVTYLPETSFDSLIGCPINGNWSITITDYLYSDNGYIFNWGIDLNQNYTINQQIISQSWNYSSDIVSSNGNNITVIPPDSGAFQYTYTAVNSFGCSSDTTISIEVLPAPYINIGNDTTLCGNQNITLNSGVGYFIHTWSTGSNQQMITLDSTSIGYNTTTISVNVWDYNGCSNSDTIKISFVDCTGINDNDTKAYAYIYPNPSNGMFTLTTSLKVIDVKIYNISGAEVFSKKLNSNNGLISQQIDLRNLSKGTYFIKIQSEKGVIVKKYVFE